MKAQSLRRLLHLVNVALILCLVAAGAWYVLRVRPASASSAKSAEWVKKSMETYLKEAGSAVAASIWQVGPKDLDDIVRPDLLDKEKGPGVWPYVGPVPPKPQPKERAVEAPKGPTGLEAIGKPTMLMVDPGERTLLQWLFTTSPKPRTFFAGEFMTDEARPKGENGEPLPPKKSRFRFVDASYVNAGDARKIRVVYDVFEDLGKDEPTLKGQVAELPLGSIPNAALITAGAETGKGETSPALPVRPAGTPPTVAEVRPSITRPADGVVKVEFDQVTSDYFTLNDADRLLGQVKTEEHRDRNGNPDGVRVTGLDPDSVAAAFDIRAGDILKSINGIPVHNRAEAIEVAKKLSKETTNVAVVIERNGRDIVYNVDPRDPKVRSAAGKVKYEGR